MKIRNGFVSNSSSSSFLIYGCSVSDGIKQIINTKLNNDNDDDYDSDDMYRNIEKIIKNTDLNVFADSEYEYFFIGKSWDEVKDDETGKQFKDSIIESIKSILGDDIRCRTISSDS